MTHKYGSLFTVKTTLEIPDPLFRKAKTTAAQQWDHASRIRERCIEREAVHWPGKAGG